MTKKTVLAVLLACVMALAFGCATVGVTNLGTQGLPDGSTVTTLVSTSPDPWQLDGKAMDRFQTSSTYDPQTKKFAPKSTLVKGDAGFTDGLGKQVVVQWGSAAIGGGSMIGAAAVLRPSNVTAGNNSGNNSQGQDQGQQQQQKQKQGQKQGQLQGQSQKTDVKNTNTNLNTNLNSNSNKNDVKAYGGAGGAGGQGGAGGAGGGVTGGINTVVQTGDHDISQIH
jgi:hypothetical protein